MGEIDLHRYDSGMGQISTDVAKKLSEGADEVYARIREDEKKDVIDTSNRNVDGRDLSGLINIAVPLLVPPDYSTQVSPKSGGVGASGGASGASGAQQWFSDNQSSFMEGLTRRVLDSMVESAAKAVEQSKEHGKQMDAAALAKRFERMLDEVRGQETQGFLNPHTISAAAVMMAGMLGVMAGGVVDLTDPFLQSMEAIQSSVNAATAMVPSDMRAELGYIGALLAGPALFQALALTVNDAGKSEAAKQFAQNFGERLMTLINDKNFNAYLQTVIQAKAPGDSPLTSKQMDEYMTAFKIGLLTSALALDYKAEHGGVTGVEVWAEIDKLPPSVEGEKANLKTTIRDLMQHLTQLNPQRAAEVRMALENFIKSNTSTEALTNPLTVFKVAISGPEIERGQATRTAA